MSEQWDAITIYPDGTLHVKRTPTRCRWCFEPIESPDVPYCSACTAAFVAELDAEDAARQARAGQRAEGEMHE